MSQKKLTVTMEALNGRQMMSATVAVAESAVVMNASHAAARTAETGFGLNAVQKNRVEKITSTFENTTLTIQYAFFSDINDGRGYTAGRCGFTSGTGDMHELVQRYTNAKPNNALAKYLPTLKNLSDRFAATDWTTPVGDTAGLEGMKQAWATVSKDAAFTAAQDSLSDDWYYTPAMTKAEQLGLNGALAKGQLWDAMIQHGDGDDYDSVSAMAERTSQAVGGTPAEGIDEKTWINQFLQTRRASLAWAANADTRIEWAKSVNRVDAYIGFTVTENYELTGVLNWTANMSRFTLPAENGQTTPTNPVTPTTPVKTTGSITGTVFIDHNHDGKKNNDDYGNEWRVVFIDADNDMYRDDGETWTYTDAAGKYRFDDVATGTHNVRLDSVNYTWSTTAMNQRTTVAAGQDVKHVDFGEVWA